MGNRGERIGGGGWLHDLLPATCVVCGRPLGSRLDSLACQVCWARAPGQRFPRCSRCGIALRDVGTGYSSGSCGDCDGWIPYLREARSPFLMAGSAAAMVHALKYGGWCRLAKEMAASMMAEPFSRQVEEDVSVVVPVPLSAVRMRERGFNQAELLARELARARRVPIVTGTLVRAHHTRRQASLSLDERRTNVEGAFEVARDDPLLDEAHVILVDDVLTTGKTAEACVRALCGRAARAVSVCTFARTRPELPVPA